MALYLVQHGRSLAKEEDPERGLSGEGEADTRRIADVARGYGVKVAVIRHSGRKRALQTAGIFAEALGPAGGVEEAKGLNPLDDAAALAAKIGDGGDVMYVGHLPFMSRLTSLLVAGNPDTPVFSFQNSGIVCLDLDPGGGGWTIRWTLMPEIR